jgi:signal transduction histidine kinase
MTDRGIVRGEVDGEGRLLRADEALLALEVRAGGGLGLPLATPQIAILARLARRLEVLVARGVTVADAEADLDLWVRAEPSDGGVSLAIADWRERQPWRSVLRRIQDGPALPVIDDDDVRWETDATMRLTHISRDANERFGIEVAPLLGQPLTQAFQLVEDARGNLPILMALAAREGFVAQLAMVRGTKRAIELSGRARLDPTGGFAGFVGSVRRAPGSADNVRSDLFSARLDQALRAPLGRIVANADTIHAQGEGPLRQDYVGYAADIASAGRHLIGLIDDLSDLQAIERADFAVEVEPLDVADVARRAAGLLQVRASDSGVRIERPAPGDRVPATGEFRRALQVVVNLIGNAVRYSPPGGAVWVRAEHAGDHAVVSVSDQGPGIAPENQARVFEKFERVDPGEPGGSGLGLYIARRLARAMGGDLTLESVPGQGARFTFTLPAA